MKSFVLAPAATAGFLCLFGTGCAEDGLDGGRSRAPIYDADEDASPDAKAHPQVMSFIDTKTCTGWLAASNVIVTAAHCVGSGMPIIAPVNSSGAAASALFQLNTGTPEVFVHPSYVAGTQGSDLAAYVYSSDLAIPRKALVPLAVAHRGGDEPEDTHVLLGAGTTAENCSAAPNGVFRLWLESGMSEDSLGIPTVELDFDDSTPCQGDSGGPILSWETKEVLATASGMDDEDLYGPALWMTGGEARTWLREVALDRDGDGFEAAVDNCDWVHNPGQEDFDGDGVGDPCDICAAVAADDVDGDGDGTPDCADPCSTDGQDPFRSCQDDQIGDGDCDGLCDSVDSCPYIANFLQDNANQLSESYLGAEAMGDVCEPVPVPIGAPGPVSIVTEKEYSGSIFAALFRHVVRDRIVVKPQPSRRTADDHSGVLSKTPSPLIPTHFRFCQDDPAAASGCTDFENLGDAQLHLGIDPGEETPLMRYHRVKMSFSTERGSAMDLKYDGAQRTYVWGYASDAAFWTNPAYFNPPLVHLPSPDEELPFGDDELYVAGPASGLHGTFWLHGATAIGSTTDIGMGLHGGAVAEELSNHHFPIDPEDLESNVLYKPQQNRFFFLRLTLPDPARWRENILDVVGHEGLLLVETQGGEWGVMNPGGGAQLATEHLSENLRRSLGDPGLVWASASEPLFHIGGSDAPLAVAVSADGETVMQVATSSEDGESFEGQIEHGQNLTARKAAAAAQPFALALSRFHRAVYRIGPRGLSRAAIVGDRVLPWISMASSLAVGTPLAATVSFRDHGLYVLDQIERDRQAIVRVLRYDAVRGGGVELASFARSPDADQIWLELDRDGQILVAQSSAARGRHAVFRLEVERRQLRGVSWLQGDRALAYPPLVDGAGYAFYRRVGERIEGSRSAALSLRACALSQLAAPF